METWYVLEDGEAVDPQSSDSVQLSALMHLLRQALGAA